MMKKLAIGGVAALILIIGAFFWLVAGASPDHASQEEITVELPDTYEK